MKEIITLIRHKVKKSINFVMPMTALLVFVSSSSIAGVDNAYEHIYEVMNKYHQTFDVYTDLSAAGNHFVTYGKMPATGKVTINPSSTISPHSGDTCIENSFIADGKNWGGWYFMNGVLEAEETQPKLNWGNYPNAGVDLTGATELTFWARGAKGGERIEFFAFGVGRDATTGKPAELYPDSSRKISLGYQTLKKDWTQYTINFTGRDLSYVLGGFGWVTNAPKNKNQDITFYLDDIRYNKSRLNEPRFLVSYETIPSSNDFDMVLKNVAFTYDNALTLISLLARGKTNDVRRARFIADAFIYAIDNDRFFTDGRLRNAYQGGDLILPPGWTPNGNENTVRMTGWWDPDDNKWYEDKGFVGTSTGNLAWVMIALLSYYEQVNDSNYMDAAKVLGEWIEANTRDTSGAGGYTGGYEGWEATSSNPQGQTKFTWKSTEHNIDVYVAFMRLHELTGELNWLNRAHHAQTFVEAMWDASENHFWTGTLDDGITINKSNIPLDIQAWAVMAMNGYNSALSWAENNCYTEADGFKGFDFNNDRDGIWFEGTAQMAVAYQLNGEPNKAAFYLSEIDKAQESATNNNGKGLVAASHDGVTTGFDWEYFSRLHIGATAWYTFAEMEYNPYWGTWRVPPPQEEPNIVALTVSKCTVTAGKSLGENVFNASGTFAESPPDLNDITQIDVNIVSLADDSLIYEEFIDFDASDVVKDKFEYTHKLPGAIISLTIDFNKKTFAIKAKNIDLAGLGCPLQLNITLGNYILSGEVNEAIVNGPKVPIPIQLMMGVKDVLRVDKCTVKQNDKKSNSDQLSVKGAFAVEDTAVNMVNEEFVVTLNSQTFTLPIGSFKANKGGFTCTKADATEDDSIAATTFNFNLCSFTLTIKNANIPAISGAVNFGVAFADYNEVEQVTLP